MVKSVQSEHNGETSVIEKATQDVSEVKELELDVAAKQARVKAIKLFAGDILFQTTEYGTKDEKTGKPVPSQWKLPANVARELYVLQAVSMDVHGKYRRAEPTLSELFNAPECYEKPTTDSYVGLRAALRKTNPRWIQSQEIFERLDPFKRNLTDAQSMEWNAAKLMRSAADNVISQAMKYLYEHYKNRQTPEDQSGSKRQGKSVKALLDEYVTVLNRRATSKKEAEVDKRIAEAAKLMLQWVRIDPKAAIQAYRQFDEERTAKPPVKTASEAFPVLPSLELSGPSQQAAMASIVK